MRTLKAANANEVALLGAYLHDATLQRRDIVFDKAARQLSVRVRRVGYEWPTPKRVLGLLSATSYPSVDTEIEVDDVVDVQEIWKDDAFDQPGDRHTLVELRLESGTVHLETEFLALRLTVSPFSGIVARDLAPPCEASRHFDLGEKQIFSGLAEIKRLELDA